MAAAMIARELDSKRQARNGKDHLRYQTERRRVEIHALNALLAMSDAAHVARFLQSKTVPSARHSL